MQSTVNAQVTDLVRIVLDRSPFYGESGGQVGDSGTITAPAGVFEVTDTQRSGDLIIHYGKVTSGEIKEGDSVVARVDTTRRDAIKRAHSATHILHHALQTHLGKHAQQQVARSMPIGCDSTLAIKNRLPMMCFKKSKTCLISESERNPLFRGSSFR